MTVTVTPREIRSPQNGRVPKLDSPAVSTRARARIPVTVRIGNLVGEVRLAGRRWWAWTARPLSLRAMWALSAIDEKRIPGKSTGLRLLWKVSNYSDRLAMFGLVAVAPTFLAGPLRWLVVRPTRRWGFYIVTTVLAVTYALGRG
jgi:hypothetical protein